MKIIRFKKGNIVFEGKLKGDSVLYDNKTVSLSDVEVLPPCVPSKVICVGLNYKEHAKELDMDIPSEPIIFMKPPSAIIPHLGTIKYPEMSNRIDYEAELAIIIGKEAKDIEKKEVNEYIKGYTSSNDVTARDLQKKDGQWTRAKSFDTFLPVGPYIETDLNPDNLNIRSYVNGELKQDSNTNDFIFKVDEIISFISKIMTLNEGDLILTGTPQGVGELKKGDVVEIEIEGLEKLKNFVG